MRSPDSAPPDDQHTLRPDGPNRYLRIQAARIHVRDQERSLRFYLDQLGFTLIFDSRFGDGRRFISVAPPDGTAALILVAPDAGSDEYNLIGRFTQVVFLTEDVSAQFREWSKRGVRFQHPPHTPSWGGTFTSFEDLDGNSFALLGFDDATRDIESQRLAAATKLESERRTARELEIAKEVQGRLFPQISPARRTLDYSGICVQAREVGGDYYDFLDLDSSRMGLVIGDIAGKGIGAALLMANLQAILRSQCVADWNRSQRLLETVNRLFYRNTSDNAYATLFFGEYHDATGIFRYANCGHPAAILLRSDSRVERLESTCTVLGLFEEWDSSFAECQLYPGDILALCTDGVTESSNEAEEEFGERRFIDSLRQHRKLRSKDLLSSIIDDVQRFSRPEPRDDITLIVAKCIESLA